MSKLIDSLKMAGAITLVVAIIILAGYVFTFLTFWYIILLVVIALVGLIGGGIASIVEIWRK